MGTDIREENTEEITKSLEIMKAMAESSHYFFVREIIGNEYVVPHVHGAISNWLASAGIGRVRKFNGVDIKGKLRLVLIPRDSLKSTFISSGYALWRMIKNPNERILIDSESRDLSRAILKNIKGIIDNCELIKVLWGDLNGADKGLTWNQDSIRITTRKDYKSKEDTVETSGIDVSITGRHFTTIIMDDLHSERNITSKEMIEKVKEHIQLMMPLLEPEGELIIVGTRWLDDDAYDWIMSLKDDDGNSLFDTFVHSCYNDDGTAYYPERNSLAVLALKKATMKQSLFSCQYLLDPIPEAIAPLKKSHLVYIDTDKIPLNINKFMMCDTIGDKKAEVGDYFAVTSWGVSMEINELGLTKLYLLDGFCGHFDTEEQINSIVNLYLKTRPLEFGIEKSGMNTLNLHLENNLKAKGLVMITSELKPSGRQKEGRIMQFIPYSQNGMVHINKSCNEKFLEEFLYEWTRFPKGRRDDCLDASAYVFDFMAKYPADLYGSRIRKPDKPVNWKLA